jgi:hypothetical protein
MKRVETFELLEPDGSVCCPPALHSLCCDRGSWPPPLENDGRTPGSWRPWSETPYEGALTLCELGGIANARNPTLFRAEVDPEGARARLVALNSKWSTQVFRSFVIDVAEHVLDVWESMAPKDRRLQLLLALARRIAQQPLARSEREAAQRVLDDCRDLARLRAPTDGGGPTMPYFVVDAVRWALLGRNIPVTSLGISSAWRARGPNHMRPTEAEREEIAWQNASFAELFGVSAVVYPPG